MNIIGVLRIGVLSGITYVYRIIENVSKFLTSSRIPRISKAELFE